MNISPRGVLVAASAGLLALSMGVMPAHAMVTFDSSTGTGFVGKGDVQLAFDWNNKDLQSKAKDVSFRYDFAEEYSYVCTWETGGEKNTKTHTKVREGDSSVNVTVSYDARIKNQVTGFTLTGFGLSSGEATPAVGDPCQGTGTDGTITEVTLMGSTGGLFVSYGGSTVFLQ